MIDPNSAQIQHQLEAEPVWEGKIETALAAMAPEHRNTVKAFMSHMKARGVGMRRIETCAFAIRTLEILRKDYMELTKKDLEKWVIFLNSKYSHGSANVYKATIKQFFRWLYMDDDESKEYPNIVKWIRAGRLKPDYGKHVLSKQDILNMMEHTDNPRDRAIIHVLYESGCRASELLGMAYKDIIFDQYGAVIRVNGKTGERRVRLIESSPDLRLYMDLHPNRSNPEGMMWVSVRKPYAPISILSLQAMIYKIAERAGMPDGISPHSFRHARATHLASNLTEAQMKVIFGWTGGSEMPARYVHLSGKDVDDALLALSGIKKDYEVQAISLTAPQPCPRCKTENSPVAKFCMQCSSPLNAQTVLDIEQRNSKAEEITAKVIEAMIQKAPDLVTAILREHGLISDIQNVAGGVKPNSGNLNT